MRNAILGYLVLSVQLLVAQTFTSSNLPIVIINTNNQTIIDEPKITADMRIVAQPNGQRNQVIGPFNGYDGKIGIELRGSTSQDLYDKKGYSIELRNPDGSDLEVALLGMPKESDWVLIGPYNDKTLIRDALAYTVAGRVMAYAPRTRHVEVVLNGSYQGVYLLTEKIKRDKDRVAVSKNDTDVTGGYIIKMDKFSGANNGSWKSKYKPTGATNQRTDFLYHYPKAEDITSAQKAYIKTWFDRFEDALAGPNYRDSLIGYRKYIHVPSFIDYLLINEAFRNIDAYRLSTFCYKNRDSIDSRLYMGPVWDFNISMGLADYCDGQKVQGWVWNHHIPCQQDVWLVPFWWERLRSDPAFMRALLIRWKELRTRQFATASIHGLIDSMAAQLQESQSRNFQRWPVLGTYIWPNAFVGQSYQAEINYLKNYLKDRFAWMDIELEKLSSLAQFDPNKTWEPELYPNPAQGGRYYTKVYARQNDMVRVLVTTADGRIIEKGAQRAGEDGEQVLKWPPITSRGLYFWQISINDQRVGSGKLIVID